MAEKACLIHLNLVEPRQLLFGVKDLHGHVVSLVHPTPHLSKAALPDEVMEGDLPRDGALYEEREARPTPRVLQEKFV